MSQQYPQHAVLEGKAVVDAEIRRFVTYLADRGIFLASVKSGKVVHFTEGQLERALLLFRGVDLDALALEKDELMARFGGLFTQEKVEAMGLDGSAQRRIVEVINHLDRLGIPHWAGRPACAKALRVAGVRQTETGLFAKAVKLRKAMYGVTDQYTRKPYELTVNPPPQAPAGDQALTMLLNKIKEN